MTRATGIRCPVCAWDGLGSTPWDGRSPSDEICPCCGTHFGLDDAADGDRRAARYAELRARWVAGGAAWWSSLPAPSGWDARPQLAAVGVEGRLVQAAQVRVVSTDVDLVSGLLWSAGVSAVSEEERADGTIVLRADLPPGGLPALQAALGDRWSAGVVTVDDGLAGWREHARVVRAGRVVVHPPWVPLGPVADDEVVVEIDPGPTFGHGAHPTTRLCLAALDRLIGDRGDAGRSVDVLDVLDVLDVGCGSGVLAVAALRLGARRAVGTDIDPEALRASRANAERNGVADRLSVQMADDPLDDRFGIVVANIGAAALRALAPWLVARLAPGGTLVLSGVLDPPPGDLADALAPLDVLPDDSLEGWSALAFRKPDGRSRPAR